MNPIINSSHDVPFVAIANTTQKSTAVLLGLLLMAILLTFPGRSQAQTIYDSHIDLGQLNPYDSSLHPEWFDLPSAWTQILCNDLTGKQFLGRQAGVSYYNFTFALTNMSQAVLKGGQNFAIQHTSLHTSDPTIDPNGVPTPMPAYYLREILGTVTLPTLKPGESFSYQFTEAVPDKSNFELMTLNPLMNIHGKIDIAGINPALLPPVQIAFYPKDSTAPFTLTTQLDKDGSFTLTDFPSVEGDYVIILIGVLRWYRPIPMPDPQCWIYQGLRDFYPVPIEVYSGDANGDNSIDVGDFSVLVNAFGSSVNDPNSSYDSKADFNFDGSIDLGDFGILINNYGMQGNL